MDIFAQLLANSVIAGALYTLITLGFNLIYGATKLINMAHGAVAASGGYIVFFLTQTWGWGMIPAVFAGVLGAGVLGAVLDWLIFAPLRRRKARPPVVFTASLGAFTVLQAFLAILFGAQFLALLPAEAADTVSVGGALITSVQLATMGLAALASVGFFLFLRFTTFGKVVRAISDDEEVAKMLGVNTDRIVRIVFFIGSAVAGLAGIMIGLDTGIQPTMGLFIIVEGVIPSIVGGIGNMAGGVIGALLLGFAENFGIWFIPSQWKGAIAFGLLTLFLIFRPQGIMGRK
ncbi:MAG: branched-chain amino acid ABC transporter permease [Candidatus Liptonbacteria bacterium]|nr:branched-chain amino acid ABC transporter permease [Candidatus Liptonbacteria bacterium]